MRACCAWRRTATIAQPFVNRLLQARERLIGGILLGNNLANIAASSLATGLMLMWFGDVGVVYATFAMTVVVVVFSEVLPKTIAINAPERIALLVARPVEWVVKVLGPVLIWVERFVRWLLGCFGLRIGESQPILSAREELRGAVDLLHRDGTVEKHDRDMVGGVLDLRELEVSDVMIHRTEIITVYADDQPEDVVKAVLAAPVTRMPLWSRDTRQYRRHPAREGPAGGNTGEWRTIVEDRHRVARRGRPGSCRRCGRCPSSSRRFAAARRRSRWWWTNTAR